jgi:hypothetical protein
MRCEKVMSKAAEQRISRFEVVANPRVICETDR